MKKYRAVLAWVPGLLAVPLLAQPQIGGSTWTCSTSTLNGSYSATLTGRTLTSGVAFVSTAESVGSVTFDGQSKVTFTLTANTNKSFGMPQTLSGTYTLQANCTGQVTITAGDAASFTLSAYNLGKDYLMTGQDGTYAFTASGSVLPATCPATLTAGTYNVNGTGFMLTSGALSGTFNMLGVIVLSGTNTIAFNYAEATNSGVKNITSTGTYTLGTNCSATAQLTDSTGNTYSLVFEFTAASGEDFILASSSPGSMFTGSGRIL